MSDWDCKADDPLKDVKNFRRKLDAHFPNSRLMTDADFEFWKRLAPTFDDMYRNQPPPEEDEPSG